MTVTCAVFIAASLDGYIARKNGAIDWLANPIDQENGEDYGYKEFFDSIDSMVIGRKTYEQVLTFKEWPYRGKKVVVLSRTHPSVPAQLTAEVEISAGPLPELVGRLADTGSRRAYVDGGKTIQGFLQAGLIDEMTITRIPILIGEGIPLFGSLTRDIRLLHAATKSFANGYVQSRYRVLKPRLTIRPFSTTRSDSTGKRVSYSL